MDEGAQVVIAGRSQASLHKAAIGLGAPAIAADVSQETDAARLARETAARFGGVDILVNNAGVTGQVANAEDLDMVEAISKFQSQQTGYDTALKSYAMVQKLSLFQYIQA